MTHCRQLSLLALMLIAFAAWAQPNGTGEYYKSADGKKGRSLKTAMFNIIRNPNVVSYNGLWAAYKQTDLRKDGKIWDMYSCSTNYDPDKGHGGNYKKEGDMFNREHSFPKSWFNDASPMVSDIVHVVPCDGYVNGKRSNYPFGETEGEAYKSDNEFSKLGKSTVAGYTGTVFEPADEYKGDFARIYFYMATCYEDKISSWTSPMLAGNSYPAYNQWVIDMLLRWAQDDPVSQKETDRNNAVYNVQGNRNPYVDYPGLEQYVWGAKTDSLFSYNNYDSTITPNPNPDPNPEPDPTPEPEPNPSDGENVYRLVESDKDLPTDGYYLMVWTDGDKSVALADQLSSGKAYSTVTITLNGNNDDQYISTRVNEADKPHELHITSTGSYWLITDVATNKYLTLASNSNALNATETLTGDGDKWHINITDGNAVIENVKFTGREIRYNTGSPRFACYVNSQQPIQLYRRAATDNIEAISARLAPYAVVYSIDGRRITTLQPDEQASAKLAKGLYIIDGRKVAVR